MHDIWKEDNKNFQCKEKRITFKVIYRVIYLYKTAATTTVKDCQYDWKK